jgi:hypothetical protein
VAEVDGQLERRFNSKISTIPHLNAVIAHQGQTDLHRILFLQCLKKSFRTFDEMCDDMPAMLRESEAWIPKDWNVKGNLGNQFVIVGWSARSNAMTGREYRKFADDAEYSSDEIVRVISPSMADFSLKSGAVEKLAAAQVRLMRNLRPDVHVGGTLIVCRVTKTSITTTHRMQFQEQEMAACC